MSQLSILLENESKLNEKNQEGLLGRLKGSV
jgi:hypothetical protein